MNKSKLCIAYGFEYDKIIPHDYNCSIGKSFNKNPVYCSLIIEDDDMKHIISKIKLIEINRRDYLHDIDKLAKERSVRPKWQLLFYDKEYENYIHILQGKKYKY
jgi:hypothetical protein